MHLKRWTLSLLVALAIVVVAAVVVFAGRQPAPSNTLDASAVLAPADAPQAQVPNGSYFFNYSAKFVCGYQPFNDAAGGTIKGEPVVKPGNYATDINIHNYNYRDVLVRKKLLLLVETTPNGQRVIREPESVGPAAFDQVGLKPDYATMDDCNRLWAWLHPGVAPSTPLPLMIGYLVILSPLDLDVDVVYTAATPGTLTTPSQGISIDVERVPGKRVFVPLGALP